VVCSALLNLISSAKNCKGDQILNFGAPVAIPLVAHGQIYHAIVKLWSRLVYSATSNFTVIIEEKQPLAT